jgi:hypothetical protein
MYLIETIIRSLLLLCLVLIAILSAPFVFVWFVSLLAARYFLAVQLLEAAKQRRLKFKIK